MIDLQERTKQQEKEARKKFEVEMKKQEDAQKRKLTELQVNNKIFYESLVSKIQNKMNEQEKQLQNEMTEKLSKLRKDQVAEREEIKKKHAEQTARMAQIQRKLESDMKKQQIESAEQQEKLKKIIEKKHYEDHYPIPQFLVEHKRANPASFYIQVLGCRGAGKSTFINKLLKKAKLNLSAETGVNETTKVTRMFDITEKIKSLPIQYKKVFLCDQPGIGGLEIKEAGYLAKFGPGKLTIVGIQKLISSLKVISTIH